MRHILAFLLMPLVIATNSSNTTTTGNTTTTSGSSSSATTGNTTTTTSASSSATTGNTTTTTGSSSATGTTSSASGTTSGTTTSSASGTTSGTTTSSATGTTSGTTGGTTSGTTGGTTGGSTELSKEVNDALVVARNTTATTEQPEALMHRLTNLPKPASTGAGNATTTNSTRRLTATECSADYQKGIENSFLAALNSQVTAEQAKWIMGTELFSCQIDGDSVTAAFIQIVKPGFSAQANTAKLDVSGTAFVAEFKTQMVAEKANLGVTEAAITAATPMVAVVELPADAVAAVLTAAGAATGAKVDLYYGATSAECEGETKKAMAQNLNECVDLDTMKAYAWTCVASTVARGNVGATCPTEGLFMSEGQCQRVSATAFLKVKCSSTTNSLSAMLAGSDVLAQLDNIAATGSVGSSSTTSGAFSNGLSAFAFVAMAAAYIV